MLAIVKVSKVQRLYAGALLHAYYGGSVTDTACMCVTAVQSFASRDQYHKNSLGHFRASTCMHPSQLPLLSAA
eukprot:5457-Heterococcus_DN1.PRE.2